MLRDVNVTVNEGGVSSGNSAEGVHVKIGVSPKAAQGIITIKGSYSPARIVEELGSCPLADACMDSVENGSGLIYCIPVAASVEGAVGAVTKAPTESTGTGTVTLTGKPRNAYELVIEITRSGVLNLGEYRWSLNGGHTYFDAVTIPLGGTAVLAPTGLTATFAPGASGFQAGDTYKATATAPTMTGQDCIAAMAQLRSFPNTFEFVHVVGASTKALWASAAAEAATLETVFKKPMFFVFEAPAPVGTAAEYKTALVTEHAGFTSKYIAVVAAQVMYTRMDGVTQRINFAGGICGMLSKATVQQSIGEVASFPISNQKVLKLLPEGIEDYISDLDDECYITLRQYYGLPDYYVNNARMMSPANSDYRYAEHMRVVGKMIREVRKALLPQLQQSIDISKLDSELAAISAFAMTPLDRMRSKKKPEISSARIVIPAGQDILSTESLNIEIYYVPVGYVREIKVAFTMENPLSGGAKA